jgi:hypothetical protein
MTSQDDWIMEETAIAIVLAHRLTWDEDTARRELRKAAHIGPNLRHTYVNGVVTTDYDWVFDPAEPHPRVRIKWEGLEIAVFPSNTAVYIRYLRADVKQAFPPVSAATASPVPEIATAISATEGPVQLPLTAWQQLERFAMPILLAEERVTERVLDCLEAHAQELGMNVERGTIHNRAQGWRRAWKQLKAFAMPMLLDDGCVTERALDCLVVRAKALKMSVECRTIHDWAQQWLREDR